MAQFPTKPKPAWMKNAPAYTPPPARIEFSPLRGSFVNNHSENVKVDVTRVEGVVGYGFNALFFRTTLTEDLDGAPQSYARPVALATPLVPMAPQTETALQNATNKSGNIFHADPNLNTFEWTGVQFARPGEPLAAGRQLDQRDFLRDVNGRFPVRAAAPNDNYYVPRTAINLANGDPVDALVYPYGALSNELAVKGNVRKGDFGLAIRASTGASTPFLYADAGGANSNALGECSRKAIRNLFGGPKTSETICYIVFPNSRQVDAFAQPELMDKMVRTNLRELQKYTNAHELAMLLASPRYGAESETIMRTLTHWEAFIPKPPVPVKKWMF